MKSYNKILYILSLLAVTLFTACEQDADDNVTENAAEGGLVNVETPLINYVVGNDQAYTVEMLVMQSDRVTTDQVEVFSTFNGFKRNPDGTMLMEDGAAVPVTSNSVVAAVIDIPTNTTDLVSFDVDFADLINGIVLDGSPLSSNDVDLFIGEFWEFSFASKTSDGNTHLNNATAKIAVSTRFAGIYTTVESIYWHPTAGDQGNFNGAQVTIESVDAITYHILANGPFSLGQDPDNEFYFTVDPVTDVITVPKEYNGETQTVWGGDEVANCFTDSALLPHVNCGNTNFVIKDDVNGKDRIVISHGYIRDTGTREFYQVLEKI